MDQAEFRRNRLFLGFCSKKPPWLLSGQKGREGAGMLFRRRFLGWGRDKRGAPWLTPLSTVFLFANSCERKCVFSEQEEQLYFLWSFNWQRTLLPGIPACWCVQALQTQSINRAASSSSFPSGEFSTWTLRMGLDRCALCSFLSLDN